jgi:hypothetical protein
MCGDGRMVDRAKRDRSVGLRRVGVQRLQRLGLLRALPDGTVPPPLLEQLGPSSAQRPAVAA